MQTYHRDSHASGQIILPDILPRYLILIGSRIGLAEVCDDLVPDVFVLLEREDADHAAGSRNGVPLDADS